MTKTIGIAVIGAGMAGAVPHRWIPATSTLRLATLRYVAVADVNTELAAKVAKRYGYEKALGSWQEVATRSRYRRGLSSYCQSFPPRSS